MDPAPERGFSFGNWDLDWRCGKRDRLVKIPGQWPCNHMIYFSLQLLNQMHFFWGRRMSIWSSFSRKAIFFTSTPLRDKPSPAGKNWGYRCSSTGEDVEGSLFPAFSSAEFHNSSQPGSVPLPRKQQGFLLPENKITLAKSCKGEIVPQPVRDISDQIHTVGTTTCIKRNSWTESSPAWAMRLIGRAPKVVLPQERSRLGRDLSWK